MTDKLLFLGQRQLTKSRKIVIVPERYKMVFFALVAQLAEHIHGKDKVISSILIEGSVYPERITAGKSAALRASDRGWLLFGMMLRWISGASCV